MPGQVALKLPFAILTWQLLIDTDSYASTEAHL